MPSPLPRTLPIALLLLVLAASCHPHPAKYRSSKRKGCDCPKWNHAPLRDGNSEHAIFGPPPGSSRSIETRWKPRPQHENAHAHRTRP
ncbi:MAG: hypothetical protein KIT10_07570 [Flavobacteriales bacterium]|nr:hypothetical protein [Flavobacteriales bacterium]